MKGLGTLLRALIDRLDGEVQRVYDELGLDYRPRYTPIVRHLEANGASTLRAIQSSVGVSHSAISQTVSQMAKAGLVERTIGNDARERVVALSSKGLEMLPTLHRCWEQADASTADLSAELGVDLTALLTQMLHILEEKPLRERMSSGVGR